jgi:ribosomal protein S18 acetylase RimI-like enzyme
MTFVLTAEPARPDDRPEAFRLLFQMVHDEAREHRVSLALAMIEQGEVDPSGLFVVRAGEVLRGAMLSLRMPGASGVVWLPRTRDANDALCAGALIEAAVDWLRAGGVKVAQCLPRPAEAGDAALLERHGFRHITALWFLRHEGEIPVGHLGVGSRLSFEDWNSAGTDLFGATLLRTYEQTLDCPELNGTRSVAEVLDGHRAQGRHDPRLWRLARCNGEPAGVLIIASLPETESWEIAYMGIVPEMRRQGLGREMLLETLCEAKAAGVLEVTLSVDMRNQPARALYRGLGFEPYDVREVYLAVWRR